MAEGRNSFDGIRLAAAALVVFGHAWVLGGTGGEPPRLLGIRTEALGLAVFFSLSGYLIAQSWDRCASLRVFIWHRVLRILPALWVTVLVTALVLGPVVASVRSSGLYWWTGVANYFGTGQPLQYLSGLVLVPQYRLGGVLPDSEATVNGSLWTIGVEFCCYLLVAIIGLAMQRWRAPLMLLLALVCAAADQLSAGAVWLGAVQDPARVVVYFAIGAALTAVPESSWKGWWILTGALGSWIAAAIIAPNWSQVWAWAAIPVVVVALGQQSVPGLRGAARYGDFTYGLYLWSFPVQQLTSWMPWALPFTLRLLVVFAVSFALALLSWRFVEAPALRLKSWRPRNSEAASAQRLSGVRDQGHHS